MGNDNRRSRRRTFRKHALVLRMDNSIFDVCAITDISNSGAQLKPASLEGFPDRFDLVLSKNAKVQRRCAVVWRSESKVGVKFLAKKEQ